MKVFLRGRKLYGYVSGDIVTSTKLEGEKDDKFGNRLEDWESTNYKIISYNLFLPFTLCFPSLEMQKLLGIFWQSDTIILMMPHYNFSLKLNPIRCVRSQVSLLLIFILMLIIFGNNYPLQTLN
jgi:hypothetical protein